MRDDRQLMSIGSKFETGFTATGSQFWHIQHPSEGQRIRLEDHEEYKSFANVIDPLKQQQNLSSQDYMTSILYSGCLLIQAFFFSG